MHTPSSLRPLGLLIGLALLFGAGCASDDTTTDTSDVMMDPVLRALAARGDARDRNPEVTPERGDGLTPERGLDRANDRGDRAAPDRRDRATPGWATPAPRQPTGPAIKVTWEALAHERYLYENPKYGRSALGNIDPQFAIVLVNENHPEAARIRLGHVRGQQSAGSGVLSNQQMRDFLAGLKKIGYFKAAAGTNAQARFFDDDRARGRVTVEQSGGSVTLLSMRGQGRSPSTRHIPAIYSQAKQAIALLKNETRTLTVETITRGEIPYR